MIDTSYQEFLNLSFNYDISKFREKRKKEYDTVFETIAVFNAIEEAFIGLPDTKLNKYLLASIVELDKLFQSAVVMFEHGLPRSANILIRTVLEVSLNIVDAVKNERHIEGKVVSETGDIIKLLEIMETHKIYNFVKKDDIRKIIDRNNVFIKDKKQRKLPVRNLAEKYNLIYEYVLYRLYCCDTHMMINALN